MSLPPSLRFSFLSTYTKINPIKLIKYILINFLLVCLLNHGIQKASLPQGGSQIPRWPPRTPTFLAFTPCVIILSPINRVGLCDWNPEAEAMTGQDITFNTGLWKTAVSILGARPLLGLWEWPAAIAWGHSGGLWKAHEVKNGGLWPTANRNWDLPSPGGKLECEFSQWWFNLLRNLESNHPATQFWFWSPENGVSPHPEYICCFKFLVMCYTAIDN